MDLDDEIVQEGTETGSLDFDFDDPEDAEVDDKLSPDQVDDFYGKLKDELGQDDASKGPTSNADEKKTITVVPLEKVGDVSFGMSRDEVRNIFGDASEFNKSSLSKNTTDDFGFCHVFYKDDKCEAVELFNTADVVVNGTSIFNSDFETVKGLFPDVEDSGEGFISKEMSVGVYAPDNQIQSILFGCRGYYDSTSKPESTDEPIEEPTVDDTGDLDLDAETVEDTTEKVGDGNEEVTQESMFDDDFAYLNRHASTLAKTWKESQYSENHTKTVSDLVDEYRKYYETNFRIKKSILDKALDVISRRLTELFNKGYVCGGYFDGYKMIIFHKDWLNKEINQFRIKDNPAYLLYIETSMIPHAQLGVDVREDRYDYDGKKELGSTRKLMETVNNSTTQESYVQEADAPSDDDTVEEAIEKENTPDEEPRTEETIEEDLDMDFDFDFDAPTSTEDALAGSETPEGDDLSTFGTDTSDVQNEYDPKEIEILNKLIAAEGEAINDYFDASKDSHDSNARRLYSDIGHEERFHMEQLLFQKAQFTGEKYEPRDPEVKKEFEELLQLGMDDSTAMHAAIDKKAMENSGPSDEGMSEEILEYSTDNVLSMLHTTSILMEAGMYAYYHRADNTAKQYGIILEAYVVQEEVMNTAKAPKELKGTPNPFALLLKGFRAAVSALSTLTANIREKSEMNRINRNSRMEWLKKNGITGLFKSGKYFYFYNDTDNAFNMVIPVQYVDLLYRLSVDIGKKCGVTVTPQGYHGTIKNPIKYNSIEDGMNKIRSLNMTKTKVIVTDQNKDALVNEFFGYSDKKINVKVWNEEANRAIYESNNVYNKLMCFAMITGKYAQVTDQIMEVMKGLQGNMNSIYYKDRNAYNKYVGYMETIVKTYIKISQAATSDLSEMLSLDKEGVKDVTATRDAGGKLPEGTEDRRTSGALGDNRSNKKYAKTKK